MNKGRLEAFSDGVIAIIITIMVLEMKVPAGHDVGALLPLWPVFLSYVLSFVYLGIYWNNHHHMLHATRHISGGVLWANLHLLFWLSLVPFVTGWMGESHFAPRPMAIYGAVMLMAAIAYWILLGAILRTEGPDSLLARAVGHDRKEQDLADSLRARHRRRVREPGDLRRALRDRGADLGDPGSPDRARAGRRPGARVDGIAETSMRPCAAGSAA